MSRRHFLHGFFRVKGLINYYIRHPNERKAYWSLTGSDRWEEGSSLNARMKMTTIYLKYWENYGLKYNRYR